MEWQTLNPVLSLTVGTLTVLLLAGLGLLLHERAGVVNLGAEGMMLLAGALGYSAYAAGQPLLAALAIGAGAGLLLALLFAAICVGFNTNHYAVGLGVGLMGMGLAALSPAARLRVLMPPDSADRMVYFWLLPVLALGLAWLLHRAFVRARWAQRLSALGRDAQAALRQGAPVRRPRVLALLAGGALCGISGSAWACIYTQNWHAQSMDGLGWIALALTAFATWQPLRLLVGAVLFASCRALALLLCTHYGWSVASWQYALWHMLPFAALLVGVVLFSRSKAWLDAHFPHSIGKPL